MVTRGRPGTLQPAEKGVSGQTLKTRHGPVVGHFLVCPGEVGRVAEPPPNSHPGGCTPPPYSACRKGETVLLCPSQTCLAPGISAGGHGVSQEVTLLLGPCAQTSALQGESVSSEPAELFRTVSFLLVQAFLGPRRRAGESSRGSSALVSLGEVNEGSVTQTCLSARDHGSVFHSQIPTVLFSPK